MHMKIYFAWSIRWWRHDKDLYMEMIAYISQYGQVLTEHIWDVTLSEMWEQWPSENYIYQRDVSWIEECDIVIAEVTTPSLGVWYEIAYAESLWKPIYCFYRVQEWKRLSAMLTWNSKLNIIEYTAYDDECKTLIAKIFDQ